MWLLHNLNLVIPPGSKKLYTRYIISGNFEAKHIPNIMKQQTVCDTPKRSFMNMSVHMKLCIPRISKIIGTYLKFPHEIFWFEGFEKSLSNYSMYANNNESCLIALQDIFEVLALILKMISL